MNRYALLAILAGVLALGVMNYAIYENEKLLNTGEIIFIELAPVDPRSLMQGDYMALRFAIGNEIRNEIRQLLHKQEAENDIDTMKSRDGHVVVSLNDSEIATFQRLDDRATAQNERVLQYRLRNGRVKFATNAFFFEEGTAKKYEKAEYGEFRINAEGDILLTGLRDESLERLGPTMKR